MADDALVCLGGQPGEPGADERHAPCGNYPVAGDDCWIAIAVVDDTQWKALAHCLGDPAWMQDARFATEQGRRDGRSDVDRLLSRATSVCDGGRLVGALGAAGIAAAPLLRDHELASCAQFVRRGLFEAVPHPVLGDVPVYRLPWHVDGRPIAIPRRAPLLGEHTSYVLEEILGLDPGEVARLRAAGALD